MRGRAKNEGSVKKMHAGYAFIFGGEANEETGFQFGARAQF